MSGLIVAPELNKVLVAKHGTFTFPAEDAVIWCRCARGLSPCEGIEPNKIPQEQRKFELLVKDMGDLFIRQQQPRGLEWVEGDLRLHGPFPSMDFNKHLVDVESSQWRDAMRPDRNGDPHPELALDMVFEQEGAFNPYVDYKVIAHFLRREVLTEVVVNG